MSWISHLQAASVFIFDKTRPVTIRKEGVCGEEEHVSAFVMMRWSDIAINSVSLYRIMFISPYLLRLYVC